VPTSSRIIASGRGPARGALASVALGALLWMPGVGAQLRLPTATLPPVRALPDLTAPVTSTVAAATSAVGGVAGVELGDLRKSLIRDLLRRNRSVLDVDRAGEPVIRGEILAYSPASSAIDAAIWSGMTVARRRTLDGLDAEIVVLRLPSGASIRKVLKDLRVADPAGTYDYNHVYLSTGVVASRADDSAVAAAATTTGPARRVGLIDSGVDGNHASLRDADVQRWGCSGAGVADNHGTAVASLMVGRDEPFHGAAPGSRLFAADVYCGLPTGGAVDAIAAAFGWLVSEHVPVINVSLVGPRNSTLEAVVGRVIARGHLVVAAVGNDGPSAPPLYPAAYPGVVGVTGVDARTRVLVEANRGPQVVFAAPGGDMTAALAGGGYAEVRGTSFAAPIVAGLLADYCPEVGTDRATEAVAALARVAVDLGRPGRDAVYGYGLVGAAVRNLPRK
jgi:subtilisin family serine protease